MTFKFKTRNNITRLAVNSANLNPLVGVRSNLNTITVTRGTGYGQVVCRQSGMATAFFTLGFLMFGPVAWTMLYSNGEEILHAPWPVLVIGGLLFLLVDFFLLVAIIRQPRLELSRGTGELRLFSSFSGKDPERVISRNEVTALWTEVWTIDSDESTYQNTALLIETREGEVVALCCSIDPKPVDAFKTALEEATGLKASDKSEESTDSLHEGNRQVFLDQS